MTKPTDLIGAIITAVGVTGLIFLYYIWSIVPPVFSNSLSGILGTMIVGGVVLIGRKRIRSLDDKVDIDVKAWLNSRLLLVVNSAIVLLRPSELVSDAKAILTNLVAGSIGMGGWFLFTHFYPNGFREGTSFLVPEALLVAGLAVLSLAVARIFRYAMRSSLTALGKQMAAEFEQTVRSREFRKRAIIFGFRLGMIFPVFIALPLIYFIAADYALRTGNTFLYLLFSSTSFLMAWMTRKGNSGLQVTKSFKLSTSRFFLSGGLAILLNLGIPAFINIPYATASIFEHYSFDIILGGGMVGELSYLTGFYAMGSSYVESRVMRTADVEQTYTDTTLDRWMVIFTTVLHFLASLSNDLLVLLFCLLARIGAAQLAGRILPVKRGTRLAFWMSVIQGFSPLS